ncbi:MAG TPA: T9SS type A sorting domain-containing protein, partial [Ferruginibacter sp.]|nr:T9SS type A sorting domain-containing protein [Ferruginibacter sp.]
VVLASTLKRDTIMAAFKAMRFYASDDWNAQVTFTVNGNYMGSDISTNNNSSIYVNVSDPDAGDNVDSIIVYSGQPGSGINATMIASAAGSNTLSFTHSTTETVQYYYFAKIKQTDGDIIWTAPVWVYRTPIILPTSITKFEGRRNNKQVDLNWTTSQENNVDRFEIERAWDGVNFQRIGSVNSRLHTTPLPSDYSFSDLNPVNGINFYRLKKIDIDGKTNYSDVVAVRFDDPAVSILSINPNPVGKELRINCNANEAAAITCNIYNSDGRLVRSLTANFMQGNNTISTNVETLVAGTYFVVLSKPNERIAESKFVKQ